MGSTSAILSVMSRCTRGESEAATSKAGTLDVGEDGDVRRWLVDVVELGEQRGPVLRQHPPNLFRERVPDALAHDRVDQGLVDGAHTVLRSHFAHALTKTLGPLQPCGREAEGVTLEQDQRPHLVGSDARRTWRAWLTFHGLDVTAVLVIAGCTYFLLPRFRDRETMTDQHLAHDLMPLVALVAISVTGLLVTFSSALLKGCYYDFLALTHMAVVVLTLVVGGTGSVARTANERTASGTPAVRGKDSHDKAQQQTGGAGVMKRYVSRRDAV